MRNIFKKAIIFLLKWLAKTYLLRVEPVVIMISGTTGRFWAKQAVAKALREKDFVVSESRKNFNAEIGLPLSILELSSGEGDLKKWLSVLWQAVKKLASVYKRKDLPVKYLVLEAAIDRPRDMEYLLSIVRPSAVILTTLTMVYQENFENLDKIGNEYKKLLKALRWDGLPVLNFDDDRILNLSKFFEGKSVTYGFEDGADYRALDVKKTASGQEFKIRINHANAAPDIIEAKINRFGRHHIYARLVEEIIKENFKSASKDFFEKIAVE